MSNSRNRNLLIIIGVLVLTNIAVLVYFLGQKPVKPEHNDRNKTGISEALQKEVGFTDEQIAQYKQLKEVQKQTIRPMFDDMRIAKDSLFKLLSYPGVDDSLLNKVSDVIAQKQKAVDMQTFNYFKKIRTLCTPEQQPRYDSVVQRMFKKMGKPVRNEGDKAEKNK